MHFVIVTIYDHNPNYGNRLQNYATQELLKKVFGKEHLIETIDYTSYDIMQMRKKIVKYYFHKLTGYRFTTHKKYWQLEQKKVVAFEKFNKKWINTIHCDSIEKIPEADYYIVGSDQVWNPAWFHENPIKKDLFLLNFTSSDKKICIAPSIGVSKLPDEWEKWFKKCWMQFNQICVREEAGAQIVSELTGKDVEVQIDPTLMLTKDDWKRIVPQKRKYGKPYILTYFLGECSKKVQEDLNRICREKNLVVRSLTDQNDADTYTSDPGEFIGLVDNAELILTDSFHACVFSFLFGKPFLHYARKGNEKNMMSRIQTLFNTFELHNRYVSESERKNIDEIFDIDYSSGYKKLDIQRKQFLEYLNRIKK